jgi:hypothetical protein
MSPMLEEEAAMRCRWPSSLSVPRACPLQVAKGARGLEVELWRTEKRLGKGP